MQYLLLNQNTEVALINIDDIEKDNPTFHMEKIFAVEKLPFLVKMSVLTKENENIIDRNLTRFIMHRLIPDDRIGIGRLYIELGANRLLFSMNSYGETMTDPFWFKQPSDKTSFDDINFHKTFSQNVGNYIAYQDRHILDSVSPDLTTNGRQRKLWRTEKKVEYLLKFGTSPNYFEPANEAAASKILETINILPFVSYEMLSINGEKVSRCNNFLSPSEEFVPACDIYHTSLCEPLDDLPVDLKLIKKCEFLGIYGIRDFLYRLRFFDYVIGNHDRHLGNFGFISNHNLQKFTGPAPVFDNGEAISGDDLTMDYQKTHLFKKELKRYQPYCKMPEIEIPRHLIDHFYDDYSIHAKNTDFGEQFETSVQARLDLIQNGIDRSYTL